MSSGRFGRFTAASAAVVVVVERLQFWSRTPRSSFPLPTQQVFFLSFFFIFHQSTFTFSCVIQTSQTWSVLTCQTHTQSSLKAFWYLHDIFLIFFLQKICCCLVVLFFFFNWPPPDGLTRWSHQNTQPADSLGSLFFFLYYMYKIYLSLSFPYHTTAHTLPSYILLAPSSVYLGTEGKIYLCSRCV